MVDHYIPPLWIMCLESVAHLMVMLNFSSNFLIYCSVSKQFKQTLSKVCLSMCMTPSSPMMEKSEYLEVETIALPTPLLELSVESIFMKEARKDNNGRQLCTETDLRL